MKDKIISSLIIISLICGVGYYFYDKYNYEGNSIVDVEVESAVLQNYYIGNAYIIELDYENSQIVDIMDSSEANYFGAEVSADENYQISQLSKSDYDNIKNNTLFKNSDIKAMDKTRDYLLKLFNMSYEDVKTIDEKYTIYYSSLLDSIFKEHEFFNVQDAFKSYFYDNIDDVFIDNEIILTCDDVQFNKICFVYPEEGYEREDFSSGNYLYLIGEAKVNVETLEYEEVKDIKIKALIHVINNQSFDITFNYLEL